MSTKRSLITPELLNRHEATDSLGVSVRYLEYKASGKSWVVLTRKRQLLFGLFEKTWQFCSKKQSVGALLDDLLWALYNEYNGGGLKE